MNKQTEKERENNNNGEKSGDTVRVCVREKVGFLGRERNGATNEEVNRRADLQHTRLLAGLKGGIINNIIILLLFFEVLLLL